MKVSILIATCRASHITSMIRSMLETTEGYDIEPVVVVDDRDTLDMLMGYIVPSKLVLDYSRTRRGALWAWNRALEISTGDVLVPAGDDQIFHKNWLDYALSSHDERLHGYGVVGLNDLAYDGNTQVATMYMMDRKYCKEQMGGVLCPPVYNYYCCDLEWNEKAKILGRFYWDSRSVVEHVHSAHGKRPVDHLDMEKLESGWMVEDNRTYQERKANGFPVVWESLI